MIAKMSKSTVTDALGLTKEKEKKNRDYGEPNIRQLKSPLIYVIID